MPLDAPCDCIMAIIDHCNTAMPFFVTAFPAFLTSCISSIDTHISMFTDVLQACMYMFLPVILWSLSFVSLFWARLVYNAYPILVNAQHDVL